MGGTSIGSMEVKLKDYLDGATVLFDAAGNVVDGHLQGDSSSWVISPTEDGKKCTRKTEPGQKYCWQHAKSKLARLSKKKEETPKLPGFPLFFN